MEVRAINKYARISAFKCREVTREIQGLSVLDAIDILRFSVKKAALLVRKTLMSAIANAENNHNLFIQKLKVKEAIVGEGPTLKRYRPKARGSAGRIRKRTSHIRITLIEQPLEKEAKASKKKRSQKLTDQHQSERLVQKSTSQEKETIKKEKGQTSSSSKKQKITEPEK